MIVNNSVNALSEEQKRSIEVMSVFGTRLEATKIAPIIRELDKYSDRIASKV